MVFPLAKFREILQVMNEIVFEAVLKALQLFRS